MDIRPIRTEQDLDWALAEVAAYFDHPPQEGTADADRFEILGTLIEAYEDKCWPVGPMSPLEILKYAATEKHSQKELSELLGSRSQASDLLSGRRKISLSNAQKISAAWAIPIQLLLAPYEPADKKKSSAKPRAAKPKAKSRTKNAA